MTVPPSFLCSDASVSGAHDYLVGLLEIVAVQQRWLDLGAGAHADHWDVLAVDDDIDKVDARVCRQVVVVGQQRGCPLSRDVPTPAPASCPRGRSSSSIRRGEGSKRDGPNWHRR